jgi:hypothetical protein
LAIVNIIEAHKEKYMSSEFGIGSNSHLHLKKVIKVDKVLFKIFKSFLVIGTKKNSLNFFFCLRVSTAFDLPILLHYSGRFRDCKGWQTWSYLLNSIEDIFISNNVQFTYKKFGCFEKKRLIVTGMV